MKKHRGVPARSPRANVSLRPVRPEDETFLFEVYRHTRDEEMALMGWDDVLQNIFLRTQFDAQRLDYETRFAGSDHSVVLVGDKPAGSVWVLRRADEILILDMALLPEHRGSGVGSKLFGDLIEESEREGKPLRLAVLKNNRDARRLYERLGFSAASDLGAYLRMERLPRG